MYQMLLFEQHDGDCWLSGDPRYPDEIKYVYYNGEPKVVGQSALFRGKLGYNGNDTKGDVTEPPIEQGVVIPLHLDNVVELHPRESA